MNTPHEQKAPYDYRYKVVACKADGSTETIGAQLKVQQAIELKLSFPKTSEFYAIVILPDEEGPLRTTP